MVESALTTRYEQVKEILNRAAAGGATDYDGKGLFGQLPLEQLMEVEIHGVRMIAAPETSVAASYCHHEADSGAASRGERSGLIKGLRGLPPFDVSSGACSCSGRAKSFLTFTPKGNSVPPVSQFFLFSITVSFLA